MDFPEIDPKSVEMLPESIDVEWLNPKTNVIHVMTVGAGRRAAGSSDLAVNAHQVDQMRSCTKVNETQFVGSLGYRAAEHFAIELRHSFDVAASDHDVIQTNDSHPFILTAQDLDSRREVASVHLAIASIISQ
jgi:hypothetical protein